MGIGKKRVLQIWTALVLVTIGFALVGVIFLRNTLGIGLFWFYIYLGVVAIGLYWFYVRYCQRKEPRYPLVPPEGKGDVYFPRSNIPRPVHEDFRKMREKKRKLAKIKKTRRKKT